MYDMKNVTTPTTIGKFVLLLQAATILSKDCTRHDALVRRQLTVIHVELMDVELCNAKHCVSSDKVVVQNLDNNK